MPAWLHAFRASFTFLTRIPVGGFPYPQKTWEWISIWFPIVGVFLGSLQALIWMGLEGHSDPTRAIVVVAFGTLITGGFHEACVGKVAKRCAEYPPKLCRTILKAYAEQLKIDGILTDGSCGLQILHEDRYDRNAVFENMSFPNRL